MQNEAKDVERGVRGDKDAEKMTSPDEENEGAPAANKQNETSPTTTPNNSAGALNIGSTTPATEESAAVSEQTATVTPTNQGSSVLPTNKDTLETVVEPEPDCSSSDHVKMETQHGNTNPDTISSNVANLESVELEPPLSSSLDVKMEEHSDTDSEHYFEDPRLSVCELLQETEAPGSFAVCGVCDDKAMLMPGLEVDGIGSIGLPLSERDVKALGERCEQAPFGRGADTVVDKSVRNTKQLGPEHFRITNPQWGLSLNKILSFVKSEMGVQDNLLVEAQLYKMLLYEKGSFFKRHRDSEKADGMFATMVIVLPSVFTGGDLVVKHQKDEKRIVADASSRFNTQYAAFYADCEHELKEVMDGSRLCLVYNLVKHGAGPKPCASSQEKLHTLRAAARAWAEEFDGKKLVLMTEHLYSKAGLAGNRDSAKYKGNDAQLVQLLEAAEEANIDLAWDRGTVSLSEQGYGECDYAYCYGYEEEQYSWGETHESTFQLVLANHENVDFVSAEEEMQPPEHFEDKEPDQVNFEPTGNEGVHADRQYSDDSAIVVWPRSMTWIMDANDKLDKITDTLSELVEDIDRDEEVRADCLRKARFIQHRFVHKAPLATTAKFIDCVNAIGNKELAVQVVADVVRHNISVMASIMPQILGLIEKFGNADEFENALLAPMTASKIVANLNEALTCAARVWHAAGAQPEVACLGKKLAENVVSAMMDAPGQKDIPLQRPVDSASVKLFARLFVGQNKIPGSEKMAGPFVSMINWFSCKPALICNSYHYSPRTAEGKGPVALVGAGLKDICEEHGWKCLHDCVRQSIIDLFKRGSPDSAVSLFTELAWPASTDPTSDKFQACSDWRNIVLPSAVPIFKDLSSQTKVDLFGIIGMAQPTSFDSFSNEFKKMDVHNEETLELVVSIVKIHGDPPVSVKGAASISLAKDYALRLCNDLSPLTPNVASRSLPIHSVSNDFPNSGAVKQFLSSPCRTSMDFRLPKTQHAAVQRGLQSIIREGSIRLNSYQNGLRGYWHMNISKTVSPTFVPASSLKCSCPSHSYSSYSRFAGAAAQADECVLREYKANVAKYNKDTQLLSTAMALLPAHLQVEVRQGLKSKRKACNNVPSAEAKKPKIVVDLT